MYQKYGRIIIAGIGAGTEADICGLIPKILEKAEVVVCYHKYVDIVRNMTKGNIITYSPGEEVKKGEKAISLAEEGKIVAIVSSGDPGIFGPASVILSMVPPYIDCEIIPGVPALSFAGAKLGCPLGGNFALISLSDLLMPWKHISHQLDSAARADIPIVIINPGSKGRKGYLARAMRIISRYRRLDTIVGIAENVGLPNEKIIITKLGDLLDKEYTNQNATIFVGCTRTFLKDERWMVTDRGHFKQPSIPEIDLSDYPEKLSEDLFLERTIEAQNITKKEIKLIAEIVKRTGDFSVATLLKMSDNFIEEATKCIKEGGKVVTDSKLIAEYIKIHDIEIEEITNSINNFELLSKSIIIIAEDKKLLETIVKSVEDKNLQPKAIITVVPGFTYVPKLKHRIQNLGIPYLYTSGNRGGLDIGIGIIKALKDLSE